MKPHRLTTVLAFATLTTSAHAETWYSMSNNSAVDDATNWDATAGAGSGFSPAAAMNVANTDTWVLERGHRYNRGGSNDFSGTLQIDNTGGTNDSEFLNRGGSNFETIILNGGALNNFRSGDAGITATAVTVTANGGILGGETDPSLFGFGSLSGSADILVQGRGNGAPSTSPNSNTIVRMMAGTDYSGYSGTFVVQDVSGSANGFFGFEQDIAVATFGLEIQNGGNFNLENTVALTTLRLGPDLIPAGSYGFDDFTPQQQGYLIDNGGTLDVAGSGVVTPPEVKTGPVIAFDETSATLSGQVTDTGGETPFITIYYGTSNGGTDPDPMTGWEFSADLGTQSNKFAAEVLNLTDATTYFYRCFATNSAGDDWADATGTFTTGVPVPTTYYSTGNNRAINDPNTWNDQPNGSGNPPFFMPTAPDTDANVWVVQNGHRLNSGGATAFYGGTLQLDNTSGTNDSEFLNSSPNDSFALQSLVLNGGALNNFREPFPILANDVTVPANGGVLGAEDDDSLFAFGSLAGDADILVQGRNNGGTTASRNDNTFVRMQAGTDYSSYTGTFIVQDVGGNSNGFFGFEEDIAVGTFGLEIQDGSTYRLQNSVTVASLILGSDSIGEGTYAFSDFTTAQQAYLVDGGGTLIVGSGTGSRFEITEIALLPNDMISLIWNSRPDKTYTVFFSLDGVDFNSDAGDNFESQGESTTHVFENPTVSEEPPGVAPTLFFKVGENE